MRYLLGSALKINSYGGSEGSKTEWRRNLGCDAVPTVSQLIPWGALKLGLPLELSQTGVTELAFYTFAFISH